MPYKLENLIDGKVPGLQAVPSGYEPQEDEVILDDVEVESNPGGVWDADTQTLREQTSEELATEAFELAQTDKLVDFFVRALEDVLATVPEAEGTYNRVPTELLLKALVAHFLAQAEREAGDPTKWQQMLQILGKLRMKRSTVGSMSSDINTIEDINAEVW